MHETENDREEQNNDATGNGNLNINSMDVAADAVGPGTEHSPRCFVQSEVNVPISGLELRLCRVAIPGCGVVHRVVLTPTAPQPRTHCYDLDVATQAMCLELRQGENSSNPFYHVVAGAADHQPVLIFRAKFLQRNVSFPCGNMYKAYPDTVLVSGQRYRICHCPEAPKICFGFPGDGDELLQLRLLGLFPIHPPPAAAAAAVTTTASSRLAPHLVLQKEYRAVDGKITRLGTIGLHPDRLHRSVGASLWTVSCGEVYQGYRLPALLPSAPASSRGATSGGSSKGTADAGGGGGGGGGDSDGIKNGAEAAEFSYLRGGYETVAVKVSRHTNDHFAGADLNWHLLNGNQFRLAAALIHHDVASGPGGAVTSKDLAPYFDRQRAAGRNEHLMNEAETMAFIMQSVTQAIKEAAAATSAAPAEDVAHLAARFIGHRDVALSCDNIFIVTEYTPLGSLSKSLKQDGESYHIERLGEDFVRHVALHLLQSLAFLHERGLAHQDISLENVLVFNRDGPLSEVDFHRLDIVLIDMGHVGVHERVPALSLQHGAQNLSSAAVNTSDCSATTTATGTTCESSSCSTDGGNIGAAAAAMVTASMMAMMTPTVHSYCNLTDATVTGAGASQQQPPPLPRAFQLRRIPLKPLGKLFYRSPQISAARRIDAQRTDAPAGYYCGFSLDVWQLGVLLVILLLGELPYAVDTDAPVLGVDEKAWFDAVRDGRLEEYLTVRVASLASTSAATPSLLAVSPLALDLLRQLLAYREEDRPTARLALQHPWLKPQP